MRRAAPASRAEAAEDALQRAVLNWLTFTWATDTQRLGRLPVPHVLLHWIITAALVLAWLRWATQHWQSLAAATAAALVYTGGRAGRHLRGHRATLAQIAGQTRAVCRHPSAAAPKDVVRVTRWAGPRTPITGELQYSPDSPAARMGTHWQAEKSIEAACPLAAGTVLVFEWDRPGKVRFTAVAAGDPLAVRKARTRWVEGVVAGLFPTRRGVEETLTVSLAWDGTSTRLTEVVVDVGTYDVADTSFRDRVETVFDEKVREHDATWLYNWDTPGRLTICSFPATGPEANRKMTSRKVTALLTGAVARTLSQRAMGAVTVEVTGWVPEGKPSPHSPTQIRAGLGTADFSSVADQRRFESLADTALEAEWPDRVWIPAWRFGHDADVTLRAVPHAHPEALRKRELARMREVTAAKLPTPRGKAPTELEVTDWASGPGQESPATMVVTFGALDVTDPDKRRAVESHFDSLTSNDWAFDWDPRQGQLRLSAVPALPDIVAFPEAGTIEHERWHAQFRAGRIELGPGKGGRSAVLDLTSLPHSLIGGSTGKGKSRLGTLALYGVLANPGSMDLVLVDPKITDFTQYAAYPGVVKFGINDIRKMHEELADISQFVVKAMDARRQMLQVYGARDLGELRQLCRDGKTPGLRLDEIPRRMLVFFDEAAAAFTRVSDELAREFQTIAKNDFEQLGLLARATEINLLLIAQKPDAENIGTKIRAQCGNRVAVGQLNPVESIQVLGNTLATTLSGPRGRGLIVDDTGEAIVFQTYWLPDFTGPLPGSQQLVTGMVEWIHEVLDAVGWVQLTTPRLRTVMVNDEPREVTVEQVHWVSPDALIDQ